MYFCLRVDMDYVPWDTPDAADFGHGEPAMLIKLLDLGRETGYKFHFFVSNRSLRAFPSGADAILNDGHDLDWLCKHPDEVDERLREASELFRNLGHAVIGLATKNAWPATAQLPTDCSFQFLSAPSGPAPAGVKLFEVTTRSAREAFRSSQSVRTWTDTAKAQIREAATRNKGVTLVVRPQVLAKFDAKLGHIQEILNLAQAVGSTPQTLRDLVRADRE